MKRFIKLFTILLVLITNIVTVSALSNDAKGEQCMNFIYFNTSGRLKAHHIDDLYQGSNLTDKLYVFADFDLEDETVYTVSLMFGRKDGIKIGEVDGTRELNITNPATGTGMPSFTYLLGTDILKCAGELQISARYYYEFDVDGDGTTDQAVKGTAMVVATVNESVPTNNSQSTVLLNINRRITTLQSSYEAHDHDDEYYLKAASDAKYATALEIDASQNLILKNAAGTALSTVLIPCAGGSFPGLGTPVFFGTGTFIFDINKNYVLIPIGSPTIYMDVYKASESGETGDITYTKLTSNLEGFTVSRVLKIVPDGEVAHDPFDGTYYISGAMVVDGVEDTYDAGYLDFNLLGESIWPAYGFTSVGYYQVYELGL